MGKKTFGRGTVHKLDRAASCKCKYLEDLYKIIPTPALVVMILNYCQKVFLFVVVNFCIYQVYRKESKMQSCPFIMHMCHVH